MQIIDSKLMLKLIYQTFFNILLLIFGDLTIRKNKSGNFLTKNLHRSDEVSLQKD